MNTEYEAVAQLKFAENRLEKARNLLNAEIEKSEISDENHLNRLPVEETFVTSVDGINNTFHSQLKNWNQRFIHRKLNTKLRMSSNSARNLMINMDSILSFHGCQI